MRAWRQGLRFSAAALAAVLAAPAFGAGERLAEVASRPGVSQLVIVTEPGTEPAAVVILFAGGSGKLALWRGLPPRSRNFLVRSRALFAAAGLVALTVDVPSDRRRPALHEFRHSAEHRADIAALVRWARGRWSAPVWLVGTSRGTISAAHLGAALDVDGLVLTSSVTVAARRHPATVMDAELEAITEPVLIAHHRADGCRFTPPEGAGAMRSRLVRAAAVEIMLFEGGDPPQSEPCRARSQHGFLGIEAKVVNAIASWIRARGARPARR